MRAAIAFTMLLAAAPGALASDVDGPAALDLSRWRGKVVLVDFWASWCAPCRASFRWMTEMVRVHGPDGFVVVAVNLDEDREAADRFLGEQSLQAVHLSDPQGVLAERFGISAMPSALLFGRDGAIAYRHAGFREESEAEYERHVTALLRGEASPDAEKASISTSTSTVRPWERGRLADPDMQLQADALDLAIDDHIYFSKEGASGGRGFGGGGCGCN